MFKLDTGSQVNVIPKSELIKWEEKPAVRNCNTAVLDYSDNRVPILDAKNGFWQLPLDEESSYLTTFCTPWGRYRFLVLPFGLNSAPEEFQKAMDEIYEEDEDINPYFDEGQLPAYGSVSLTQTQQCYAQIEKELMAVIYGLEHFNYYTYGRIVTVQTDHKPILGLRKNLVKADALSRAQSITDKFDEVLDQETTVRINLLTQASPTKWEEIAKMTTGDPEMQDFFPLIMVGQRKRKPK
ncbi:retrovirus-related Pol polyprotein from transposon 17.6 [Trichonephila clavata]|uniref:Retrovirus-related Pol polyprotein from transposon 17.6 n=1 Tax=Trichonephila clavata TaxID=2740835 RepID=A0A8X6JGC0_TRICU|nr:retrovirus-related Pol polyprotein from transposon 17.6 [Trichonephila clavata]